MTDSLCRLAITRVPGWERVPGLAHGFCGRRGGASRGAFAELNLSRNVGDIPAAVDENWRRIEEVAAGAPLGFATRAQVHGTRVVTATSAMEQLEPADALVTSTVGLAVGVLTADCVPILLLAEQPRVVAAVHAGWRGTIAGIAGRVVQHLANDFGVAPTALRAALGPAIDGCCYVVGRDVALDLKRRWGHIPGAVCATPSPGKVTLDLRRINRILLERAGLEPAHILSIGPCTHCACMAYFSHRAARGVTGRQLSFIGWQD